MRRKIGLIGVPIEEIPIQDTGLPPISAYIPGITNETRESIIKLAKESCLNIEDLGEAIVGDEYKPTLNINRIDGIPFAFSHEIRKRSMEKLAKARKDILKQAKDYDLFVAIGPSHLGAITLYESGDRVARLDYHSDFIKTTEQLSYNFASYMDWVSDNVKNITVENYFNKSKEFEHFFGKNIDDLLYGMFKKANHFDIDVDCFDKKYQIQNVYDHEDGSPDASPDIALFMINKAKPKKIGIWEYRPKGDHQKNGLKFIVDAMKTATKN